MTGAPPGGGKEGHGLRKHGSSASAPTLRRGSSSHGRRSVHGHHHYHRSLTDLRPSTAPEPGNGDVGLGASDGLQSRPATTPGGDRGRRAGQLEETSPPSGLRRESDTESIGSGADGGGGGGRFSADEIRCFRRVPAPSGDLEAKLGTYWQTTGKLRGKLTADCWHSLPVLKGKFFQNNLVRSPSSPTEGKPRVRSKDANLCSSGQPMPSESLTASVLDVIYPRTPPAHAGREELAWTDSAVADTVSELPDDSRGMRGRSQSPQATFRPGQLQAALLDAAQPTATKSDTGHGHVANSGSFSVKEAHSPGSGPLMMCRTPSQTPVRPVSFAHSSPTASRSTPTHMRTTSTPHGCSPNNGGRGKLGVGTGALLPFRRWLHDRFLTMEDAYAAFTKELPNKDKLTKKEWRRVLSKHYNESAGDDGKDCDRKDCDFIFEQLDFRGVGVISVNEFVIAVEAAAPVRSLEDLRRRWLATGFASMTQAIRKMDDNGATTGQRLPFDEFARLLTSVNINDYGEQVALFGLICSDPDGTTSVGELASAVATVSPALLLEDVRDRLLRKYNGNLEKAFFDFDMNRCGRINRQEFTLKAVRSLGFTENEAKKAFREIDFDNSGEVTRIEFLGAIGLSEPSHLLEDLRLKVRQRFRSIKGAFARAFEESTTDDLDSQPQLTLGRVKDMLIPLGFKEQEIRLLFALIDRDQSGDLSVFEFVKGVRQFAPSCVLEDLRAMCCHRYKQVRDSFANTEDRFKLIDLDAFTKVLKDLGLLDPIVPSESDQQSTPTKLSRRRLDSDQNVSKANNGIRVADVFNIIDVRHEGKVSIDRLVAALQSCGSGGSVWLPPEELDLRAKQDVRGDMAPVHRLVHSLKDQVRLGTHFNDDGRPKASWDQWDPEVFTGFPEGMKYFLRNGLSGFNPRGGRQKLSKAWMEESASPMPGKSKSEGSLTAPPVGANAPEGGGGDGEGGEGGEDGPGVGGSEGVLDGKAPSIKTSEKLSGMQRDAPHIPRITARKADIRKPSTKAVASAQQAWGNVWKSLHTSPGHQQRVKLERHVQNYFQTATCSLARDVPLFQGDSFSRAASHASTCAHREALRPSRGARS